MSKERELLNRCAVTLKARDICPLLLIEISELLAQPEQKDVYQKLLQLEDGIEVEILPSNLWQDGYETGRRTTQPVAWRGVNFTEDEGDWLYRDIEYPFTDSNYKSVGEALYLAPPRPESLREHVDRNKEWYNIGYRAAKEELLAQPERDKVDFQTLNEMGLKRLQVSDNLVLQESCAKSPTVIFAENGNVIEIIKYKKLLEIKSFIDEILNYADTPQIGVDDE